MSYREAKYRNTGKGGFYGHKATSGSATRASGQEQCVKAVGILTVFVVRKLRGEKN